ncbi:MAG: hypothetical protein U0M66_06880 [Bacilli bacterium]|nr:hypothetical protein [Bacilli bacterium]
MKKKNGDKIEKILVRVNSISLAIFISLSGYSFLRSIKPVLASSPYDGNNIKIEEDELNIKLSEVIGVLEPETSTGDVYKKIDNMSEEQKKAVLLLHSVYSNYSYNNEDLRKLKGYTQYLLDNKYVNYERIYQIIKSSKLKKNVDLPPGIVGIYSPNYNTIKLESYDSLSHEFFHLENKANFIFCNWSNGYAGKYQRWFEEGFTEILAFEYTDNMCSSYPVSCDAIRLFTEFVGFDKMLETRSKGDLNLLVSALVQKGVAKTDVDELFNMLNEQVSLYLDFCESNDENLEVEEKLTDYAKQISNKFAVLCTQIYGPEDLIPPIVIKTLSDLASNRVSKNYYYLFNSECKKLYPYSQSGQKKFIEGDPQNNGLRQYDCYVYRVYFPLEEVLRYEYSNGVVDDVSLGTYTKEDLVELFLSSQRKK